MKNIKYIIASLLVISFLGCDVDDNINTVYDSVNGQTGVGFTTSTTSVIVPEDGVTVTVNVQSTKTSSSDRSFDVSVDEDASDGSSADYSIGSITIPAGSFDGTLDVTFGNFDNLADLTSFTLVLKLALPDGVAVVGSNSTTFNYLKKILCNDMELVINTDFYASETSWELTDSTGAVVESDGPFANGVAQYNWAFTLPDGVYTFSIFDAFGDGLYDGNVTGNYTLSCSLIIHATGAGNFGAVQSTTVNVNQ